MDLIKANRFALFAKKGKYENQSSGKLYSATRARDVKPMSVVKTFIMISKEYYEKPAVTVIEMTGLQMIAASNLEDPTEGGEWGWE